MATHGRYVPSAPDNGYGTITAGMARASKFGAPSTPIWVSHIGAFVGRATGTSVNVEYGAFAINGDGTLGDRVGRAAGTVSSAMSAAEDGEWVQFAVDEPWLQSGPIALVIYADNATLNHGMLIGDVLWYQKSGLSSLPPTWGSGSTSIEGTLSVALVGESNVKPDKPSGRSPSGGDTADSTPNLTFLFRDDNELLSGHAIGEADWLTGIRIYVRQGGTVRWNYESTVISGAERTAREVTRTYAGTALAQGDVTWKCAVRDRGGLWSDYSTELTFELASGVEAETLTPSGLITDTTPDFTWRHTSPAGASTHVQHRLLSPSGGITQLGSKQTAVVASGGTGNTPWAASGFTELLAGVTYRIQTQTWVGASGSGWTDEGLLITINGAPAAPISVSPANGVALGSYPIVRFRATDPNTPSSGLTGTVLVEEITGVDIGVRTATYVTAFDWFEYQFTPADIAVGDSRFWSPKASDGVNTGPYGERRALTMTTAPAPVITAPTEGQVLGVSAFRFTYTVTGQVRRQGFIYRADTGDLVFSTPDETTANLFFDVPTGYMLDQVGSYVARVAVTDGANVTGFSADRNFTIDIVAPSAPLNFQASPILGAGDPSSDPSLIELRWETAGLTGFKEVILWRRPQGVAFDLSDRLVRITSASLDRWVDERPLSGVTYTYAAQYVIDVGGELIASEIAEASASVAFSTTIVQDTIGGATERVVIRYWKGKKVTPKDNRQFETTWQGKPIQIVDALDYVVVTETWRFWSAVPGVAMAGVQAALRLRKLRPDQSPRVLCWRDPDPGLWFGVLDLGGGIDYTQDAVPYEAPVTFTEVDYGEGVV